MPLGYLTPDLQLWSRTKAYIANSVYESHIRFRLLDFVLARLLQFSSLAYGLLRAWIWREWRDSNSRPIAWQAIILTNWTTSPICFRSLSRDRTCACFAIQSQPYCYSTRGGAALPLYYEWICLNDSCMSHKGSSWLIHESFCLVLWRGIEPRSLPWEGSDLTINLPEHKCVEK